MQSIDSTNTTSHLYNKSSLISGLANLNTGNTLASSSSRQTNIIHHAKHITEDREGILQLL